MELDKFITESIKSIIKGVNDSKDFATEYNAKVNPQIQKHNIKDESFVFFGKEDGGKTMTKIEFDIAVTASNENSKGGSGSINVLGSKLGGKLDGSVKSEFISRLNFTLNIVLPFT